MNEYFKRQTEEFMNAARAAQMPGNFQAFAQESVAKTREAYDKLSAAAKDHAKATEDFLLATQAGAKAIGARVIDNAAANTDAVFDAAQAIAKAKSLPEAARLQADFVQKQFAVAGEQTKELFELSARVAQQAFRTVNEVAAKSFDQMKNGV
jgi:phasin family protein